MSSIVSVGIVVNFEVRRREYVECVVCIRGDFVYLYGESRFWFGRINYSWKDCVIFVIIFYIIDSGVILVCERKVRDYGVNWVVNSVVDVWIFYVVCFSFFFNTELCICYFWFCFLYCVDEFFFLLGLL